MWDAILGVGKGAAHQGGLLVNGRPLFGGPEYKLSPGMAYHFKQGFGVCFYIIGPRVIVARAPAPLALRRAAAAGDHAAHDLDLAHAADAGRLLAAEHIPSDDDEAAVGGDDGDDDAGGVWGDDDEAYGDGDDGAAPASAASSPIYSAPPSRAGSPVYDDAPPAHERSMTL